MAKVIEVTTDDVSWTVAVDDDRVTLQGVEDCFIVREAIAGRWSVERAAADRASRPVDAEASRLLNATATAALSSDAVWVGIEGYAIEFRLRAHPGQVRSVSRDQDALSPPMSATVVRVQVRPGDRVAPGDTLVVLEAMKMELPIRAPRAATVRAVHCVEGQPVNPGEMLIELDD